MKTKSRRSIKNLKCSHEDGTSFKYKTDEFGEYRTCTICGEIQRHVDMWQIVKDGELSHEN